jgi:hypothetical protein
LDGFAKTLMWRISFMNISMIDWIGYLAATMTTSSFVPQAWLTLKRVMSDGFH